MNKIIVVLLLLSASGAAQAQELYLDIHTRDTCLFLGGITNDNWLKMAENGEIVYKKAEDLEQVGLLIGNEFTEELFRNNLCFKLEGYEPFWQATLFRDTLTAWDYSEERLKSYPLSMQTSEMSMSPDFFALFSSEHARVFGAINNIGISLKREQRICEYNLACENSLYEVYISIGGIACKGCASIEKYEEK